MGKLIEDGTKAGFLLACMPSAAGVKQVRRQKHSVSLARKSCTPRLAAR